MTAPRQDGPTRRALDAQGTDECIPWTGMVMANGYGLAGAGRKGRTTSAHRRIYQLVVGPITVGLQIDHLCRNRSCVNVRHLEPVTQSVNIRRGWLARYGDACKHGHPWAPETTIEKAHGRRNCRICVNAYKRAARAERAS